MEIRSENLPLAATVANPDTSDADRVTAPVRPATLVTSADSTPDDMDIPPPFTLTPPSVVLLAVGNVYDDPPEPPLTVTSPVWPFTLVTSAVDRSLIWLAVCVCDAAAYEPAACLPSSAVCSPVIPETLGEA
jgi:hypothetical protein